MRQFTVIDTETQKIKQINSEANNIAELKHDMIAAGFNLENKTIQEGLTRTEFKDDAAILPHDVEYNGVVTNNLVFRLTKDQKHINSGADAMTRKECYDFIKEKDLAMTVKERFGKSFTQCSTQDLISIILEYSDNCEEEKTCNCSGVAEAVEELVDYLYDEDCLDCDIYKSIKDKLHANEISGPYTKGELDDMFKGM